MTKKREPFDSAQDKLQADKAAQNIMSKEMRLNLMPGLKTSINLFMMNYYL
ncbi:MAG: hypothetical protein K0R77_2799 [Chryseobacterium sp.]|jgi:hypothetical protein|nr:hypothetical protein [Chryseobacterium sp.]